MQNYTTNPEHTNLQSKNLRCLGGCIYTSSFSAMIFTEG